jgi:hypothetical protein
MMLAVSVVPAAGQTFVVDEQGGAGSHFRDLPAAIAAVPRGATLIVRPGNYSPFVITKALTVLGEQRDRVVIHATSASRIGPLAVTDPVHVSRITIAGAWPLQVVDALGPVVLETARFHAMLGVVAVERSKCVHILACEVAATLAAMQPIASLRATASSIHLHHTLVIGQQSVAQHFGRHQGGPGLWLEASDAFLSHSLIGGGRGGPPITYTGAAGHGGTGVLATGAARVFAAATTCAGGDGGDDPFSISAGDGGSGVVLSGGTWALLESVVPRGGTGGRPNGKPGAPYGFDATSRLVVDLATTPILASVDTSSVGRVRYSVSAPAQSVALLLLGVRPTYAPLVALAPGALLLEPLVALGPLVVDASGVAALSLPASAWPQHVPLHGQFAVVAHRPRVTNAVVFVAR